MDISSTNRQLESEFAIKKIKAENIAYNNRKTAESNENYVKLIEIERKINFELGKIMAENKPDKNKIEEYLSELKQISSAKKTILKKLGLTSLDLLPKYECELCNDTGFVGGQMCDCFRRRRNAEIIKQCGIKQSELVSFDEVNEKLFKNERQLDEFRKLKIILQKWCNSYPNVTKTNIILCGATGIGKTFLTKCMAKSLLEKNALVCYVSAFEMDDMFLKYHSTFDYSKSQFISPLIESDILFIDDLGTEPIFNNVTTNYLYLILSERERFSRPTIITTNISLVDIRSRYDERVFSRLSNKNISMSFMLSGDDLRGNKTK